MPMQEYLDFDLRLQKTAEGYEAVVVNAPAGNGVHPFTLPFSEDKLQVYLLQIGQRRAGVRRADSPNSVAARELGSRLFESVFAGEVRDRWYQSLAEASHQNRGLRLRLRLKQAPELADLPWEFLYDREAKEFILLSAGTPLVHHLELPEAMRPLAVQPPLRALVMVASPTDYEPLDVEREWSQLQQALEPLEKQGVLAVDRLAKATLPALQSQLRKGEYHIFHFIGHGAFETGDGAPEGVLLVEDDHRRGRKVTGRDLAIYLRDEDTLRLVVLNCCEGARTSPRDIFAGVAQTLSRRGIPAVIAMQFEISDTAALVFAGEFYRALADGWPADAALAEARKAIYGSGNAVEWGTPVLHMHAPDGRIFELSRSPERSQPSRVLGLLQEAETALRTSDWSTAQAKAEAALTLEPGHAAATESLARARTEQALARDYEEALRHLDAGRWEQGVASLQAVLRIRTPYRDAQALLEKAKARWRDNLVGPPPERKPGPVAIEIVEPRPPEPRQRRLGCGLWISIALPVLVAVVGIFALTNYRKDSLRDLPPAASPGSETPAPRPAPPPQQQAADWRLIANGAEHDTSDEELRTWIAERRVNGETLLKRLPDGSWGPLSTHPELAALLPQKPAPPPVETVEQEPEEAPPEPDATPAPAERAAGFEFVPAPAIGFGAWDVKGWIQDAGAAREQVRGKLLFSVGAFGGFAMVITDSRGRRTFEGGWFYNAIGSVLEVRYPDRDAFGLVSDTLRATTRDGSTFHLKGTNRGRRTELEIQSSTVEAFLREMGIENPTNFDETLRDLLQ